MTAPSDTAPPEPVESSAPVDSGPADGVESTPVEGVESAPAEPPTVPAPPVGRAPAVLLLSSLGVVLVALAYQRGRTGGPDAEPLYWAGQALVFVPVVARMLARRLAGSGEAFLLVVGLAVNQYLLKWMYSPDQLRFPDELQHFAATTTVLSTGRLFEPNPALPVGTGFPGLAEMAAGVAALTGLSVTASGLLVAGVARLVFVGLLYTLLRRAGAAPRVAGLACLVYTTGQHYLFFNAMFLYQTGALAFLLLAVWAVTARHRGHRGAGTAVAALVAILVVTVTHHVTAIMMVGTLLVLAVLDLVVPPRAGALPKGAARPRRGDTAVFAGLALAAVALWIAFPARLVLAYFEAPAERIWDSMVRLFTGATDPAPAGPAAPRWQLVVQAAVLLVLLVLLLRSARAARRIRPRDPWRYAVLAGGLTFFAGYGLWLAGPQGPELAGRVSTFTYLPMSMVAAAELLRPGRARAAADASRRGWRWLTRHRHARSWRPGPGVRLVAGTVVLTLFMVGARAGGWPPWWERLPGPQRPGAFERSVDAHNVTAARWTGAWLGRGHRIAADATGWILLASYSYQSPIGGQAAPVYYSPRFGLREAQLLDQLSVEYVWVDLRMSEYTPPSGAYFTADPESGRHNAPVPRENLTKFGELPGVNLVYDSGDIRIYDVRDL
ncbi:hypothetical protein AB0J86_18405 [Micromonospora sp. NPDC049559]|uniref:hypothetical protein n=1 Tax=Micromonospora sp. NPDC049559 TaxID=3155923 RepID=UPI0034236958